MKCPKCDYLGFETGDRCRNCGYDFSLMASPLPLFTRGGEDQDEPLVKLPPAPRAPLSVRKTPDSPRGRPAPRPPRDVPAEPVLQFVEEGAPEFDLRLRDDVPEPVAPAAGRAPAGRAATTTPGRRIVAALIDHLLLFAIDATVIYFTLRMASLPAAEWRLIPAPPLVAFLLLLKFAYFFAFTAVGGQTIGKMALQIRVVGDDNGAVDGARALRRTLAGAACAATFGLGFVPALVGPERRALHDRIARTRVIGLRSA
jgi:uncharacterized RDD family membrane protein YckC